jgi:hypothetical protein
VSDRKRAARILPDDPVARLTAVGEALYGDNWQAPLARALKRSKTAVSNWSRGEVPRDLDAKLVVAAYAEANRLITVLTIAKELRSRAQESRK